MSGKPKPSRRLLFPLIALFLLAECGVRFGSDGSDPEGAGVDFVFDGYHLDSRMLRSVMAKRGGFDDQNVFMSINPQGRRGTTEHPVTPAEGKSRVVVVGTGNAFGFRVPDGKTWPEQLEQDLGSRVEVFNLAYPGSTVVYLDRSVREEVLELSPDVVLIAYAGYNEALLGDESELLTVDPDAFFGNTLRGLAIVRLAERIYHRGKRWLSEEKRVPHVDPITYEHLLEQQVKNLVSEGIQVVLMQEVVVYPDVEGFWYLKDMESYRSAMDRVAQRTGTQVFDPADVLPAPGPNLDGLFVSGLIYGEEACSDIAQGLAPIVRTLLDRSLSTNAEPIPQETAP
jgi:hypothetical protein